MTLVVAALVAATPAHAQKLSLADRVGRLEAQANNTQANQDLLQQLAQLRNEVQSLRDTVERLQHENQQLQQRSRDQYLDLDGRLNRLEGGNLPAPPEAPAAGAPSASQPAPDTASPPAAADAPRVHGDPGSLARSEDERAAYNAAFDALKDGRYDESAQLFQAFLDTHPAGIYAPNALYWLGESYYVTGNYRLAGQQFESLIGRYPTHDKAPGALLKLGLAQYGDGQVRQAEGTLEEVVGRFPGTDAARIAADRLQSIQLGQLR
ncbi:tol-pal system protein YbgF [Pseudoxanthomonas broegbernensis]|uniref:Cell division coordinator CpoB n=2 Tax=Pseudoxanthomonas broegbernensis TaxID=83619 RepID=A0A7V8GKK4_9GAMM|nr:tol-pal system protein YbgF [Pseudoxanthomonas broegbernensis]